MADIKYKPVCIPVKGGRPIEPSAYAATPAMFSGASHYAQSTPGMMSPLYTFGENTHESQPRNLTWLWWLLGALVLVFVGVVAYNAWRKGKEEEENLQPLQPANGNGSQTNGVTSTQANGNQLHYNSQQQLNDANRRQVMMGAPHFRPDGSSTLAGRFDMDLSMVPPSAMTFDSEMLTDQEMKYHYDMMAHHNASQPMTVDSIPLVQKNQLAGSDMEADANHIPGSAIKGGKASYNGQNGNSYGGTSMISSRTSDVNDDGLFGYFEEPDAPLPTPGQGMPASYMEGGSSKWREVPIAPLEDFARFQGTGAYDPDCDDSLVLPPRITLEQQRKSIQREAALRPASESFLGRHKNIGSPNSIWQMMNPPPDRVGAYKPSGNIAFGISDSYWSAASADNPSFTKGGMVNKSTFQGFPSGLRDPIVREDSQLNTFRNPPVMPEINAQTSTEQYIPPYLGASGASPYAGGFYPEQGVSAPQQVNVIPQLPQITGPAMSPTCYGNQPGGNLGVESHVSSLGDSEW